MIVINSKSYDTELMEGITLEGIDKIEKISFSYDGGRLTIIVNGEEVYSTKDAGSDCNIEMECHKIGI